MVAGNDHSDTMQGIQMKQEQGVDAYFHPTENGIGA
jgi:hypothetical protein